MPSEAVELVAIVCKKSLATLEFQYATELAAYTQAQHSPIASGVALFLVGCKISLPPG